MQALDMPVHAILQSKALIQFESQTPNGPIQPRPQMPG